mmetsp:Transcript_15677/g.7549  ORF Transcript_15677/g.7549 Transcript_15677/m.7549 type:complete len:95 (-) Transcript_15677:117-401(-)
MLIHKGERHWESMTYNQHPLQHDIYEVYNKYCHENYGKDVSEQDLADKFLEDFKELLQEKRKSLGLESWQTLETNVISEAFYELMKRERKDPGS